ncbi:hypothetical protein B0H10DRAFT_2208573 [Mycena sp. CBHHK59/15]|nr:hypothetical protein B0H10DRAFT_2208573 [Mycena sp. CBHHK59/15]
MKNLPQFDRRVTRPPNWTYGVLIGCIPSHSHHISGFYITTPGILQVAHYLVRPGTQSLIIPASEKAKLFDVARAQHPIFENYVNDWATEEIVKRYIKNKRRLGYRQEWLDVPDKYKYLKANSAKRDPSASRKRRFVSATAPKKAAVRVAAKKSVKKSKTKQTTAVAKSKGKGKQKAQSVGSDDDGESMEDADDDDEE